MKGLGTFIHAHTEKRKSQERAGLSILRGTGSQGFLGEGGGSSKTQGFGSSN